MLTALLCFLAGGAVAGVFAGLLGVGGGIIIVPLLSLLFPFIGVPQEFIHHLALGTSLASIIVTSISSAKAHNKRDAVRWDIFKAITPGILLGTFVGGLVAADIPNIYLRWIFAIFLYAVALEMLFGKKPEGARHLPGTVGISAVGGGIGLMSSFVGIGGGTMSVPFMTFCSVPMRIAVGTSSAIGFPIAVAGTLGYIVGGLNTPNLPEFTLGYVHLLGFVGIAAASFVTAPLGARLAHTLPVPVLKRFFAVFLLIVASRMLWNLI